MGVSATRATTATDFANQFANAMQTEGPYLIEAVLQV
jgi:thiamine pyrophosphate-dependent acetolactate synthase large subunit-like protein